MFRIVRSRTRRSRLQPLAILGLILLPGCVDFGESYLNIAQIHVQDLCLGQDAVIELELESGVRIQCADGTTLGQHW